MKNNTFIIMAVLAVALGACSGGVTPEAEGPSELNHQRLIMSYRPDVQFSPLYVAVEKGSFQKNGLEIEFNHLSESEALQLVGADEVKFAIVSAEQIILARAQGLPVVYVATWWHDYPIGVAAPEGGGIETPADLVGKRVGFPGVYGASYIGYRALLSAAGVPDDSVTLDAIGFNQVEALYEGLEDAVVIYANNEPVQLEAQGFPVTVIRVAEYVHLPSNGLVTNEKTIAEDPDLVQSMVNAFLAGIQDAIENPDEAYRMAEKYVDGLTEETEAVQRGVLAASIEFWKSDRLGNINQQAWENMQRVLLETELLQEQIDLSQAYSTQFLR